VIVVGKEHTESWDAAEGGTQYGRVIRADRFGVMPKTQRPAGLSYTDPYRQAGFYLRHTWPARLAKLVLAELTRTRGCHPRAHGHEHDPLVPADRDVYAPAHQRRSTDTWGKRLVMTNGYGVSDIQPVPGGSKSAFYSFKTATRAV